MFSFFSGILCRFGSAFKLELPVLWQLYM